jgi:hypothetical protein
MRMMERRSFNRAAAALAMTTRGSTVQRTAAAEVLQANWRDDDAAKQILKAATSPLTTSNFAAIQSTKFVEMLAPDCAAAKLLSLGYKFDLSGINSIKLPFIGGGGRPPKPVFIAEGQPAPVVDLATSDAILGPTCKVLIQSAITGELQSASAETAEEIIGMALAISTAQSLDAALFSNNAATPSSPAGILHCSRPCSKLLARKRRKRSKINWLMNQSAANPSQGHNSLLTGKFTGKLRIFGHSSRKSTPKSSMIQRLVTEIPRQQNRELIRLMQGIGIAYQGIYALTR